MHIHFNVLKYAEETLFIIEDTFVWNNRVKICRILVIITSIH